MRKLFYTTKPPTAPGWYWCKHTTNEHPSGLWEAVVRVDFMGAGVLVGSWMTGPGEVGRLPIADCDPAAEWAGPILLPV